MNIYVGNLDYKISENELNDIFSQFGQVESVKIITDRETGRAKGFAFVEMANDNEGEKAIKELNGAEFNNRALRVNKAMESKPRNSRY